MAKDCLVSGKCRRCLQLGHIARNCHNPPPPGPGVMLNHLLGISSTITQIPSPLRQLLRLLLLTRLRSWKLMFLVPPLPRLLWPLGPQRLPRPLWSLRPLWPLRPQWPLFHPLSPLALFLLLLTFSLSLPPVSSSPDINSFSDLELSQSILAPHAPAFSPPLCLNSNVNSSVNKNDLNDLNNEGNNVLNNELNSEINSDLSNNGESVGQLAPLL